MIIGVILLSIILIGVTSYNCYKCIKEGNNRKDDKENETLGPTFD